MNCVNTPIQVQFFCKSQTKIGGFTLFEILVALIILAIIGSMTIVGLRTALSSQAVIHAKSERLINLQTAMLLLERDIGAMINRPIRINDSEGLPSFAITYPQGKLAMEWTRGGYSNPLALYPRSSLQRVGYNWDGNTLSRLTWPSLDRMPNNNTPTQRVLLTGVITCKIEIFYRTSFATPPHWLSPPETTIIRNQDQLQTTAIPKAIKLDLEINGLGKISRIFLGAN